MNERCEWANGSILERQYHDEEWGIPCVDDRALFEILVLETMQAGLSWSLILKRRAGMKQACDGFDYHVLATYTDEKLEQLLTDARMIRHRLKILSLRNNAKCFLEVQKEYGSFANYLWQFVDYKPIINQWKTMNEIPSASALSDKLSKDLKKKGFTFIGTKIIYSFLQATGLVNDHITSCPCKAFCVYDKISVPMNG